MRKADGAPGGGGGGASIATYRLPCLDVKPFVATLVILTLVVAIWQLQPYSGSLLTSRPSSCPLSTSATASSNSSFPQKLSSTVPPTPPLSSPPPPPSDPNKRTFVPYGNAAALFVQMGAYRGGPNTFAIVGLASKPTHVYSKPWFKCEWIPNTPTNTTISLRTKARHILPDWGYGRVYTVVVINCTFPTNLNTDNAGGQLQLTAYYSPSPRRFERFIALTEPPGTYNPSQFHPPYPYDYLYCGSSLYGSLNANRIREWIAYHAHFFGPRSHFVFHDAGGVSEDVRKVLEPWVKAGRATVQDIRGQAEYDGYYYNQFLVVNDCLHRYRHAANWTFYFDVDEYLWVQPGNTLEGVMREFEKYTQFTIEQNPMNSKLCVDDPKRNYSSEWGFEKLVFRNSITGIRRDRKYAIQARNALATGVHMSENVVGGTLHKTEDKIRYYHYHDSINVLGEPCREFVPMPVPSPSPPVKGRSGGATTWFEKVPYVYDDNMRRVAGAVKVFEEKTIGALRS